MRNEFELAFNEIKNQRALSQDIVLDALKTALISAYRRYSGASAAQEVDATIDSATGRTRILVEKEVVDDVQNPLTEVSLEKARYYNPEAQINDMVMVQVEGTTKKFGRIAAQTAKQVILQKIREAERNSLYEEYSGREGDILSGTVQSYNNNMVTISLGRAEAVMPRAHQIPGERYRQHDKVRVYLVEVEKSHKGPQITVSRSHRNMLKRLLEFEVPEIYNGQVEIRSIAREAGYRSKVAVVALQDGIDPVGACVGMRGIRIQNIVRELHEEKIDVIEWVEDHKQFISKALSPARVTGVFLDENLEGHRTAVVIVPNDQLSLAIGKEGQNARLAAKLTGWRIDIKSEMEAVESALANLHREPFDQLLELKPRLVEQAQAIVEKSNNGLTVMPEDYKVLGQLANLSEKLLTEAREVEREARLAEIEAVKATVPEELFEVPVQHLDLPESTLDRLVGMENVGEIMWRFFVDEGKIREKLRGMPESAMEEVKAALDDIMMTAMVGELDLEAIEAEAEAEADEGEPQSELVAEVDTPATAEAEPETEMLADTTPEPEETIRVQEADETEMQDEAPSTYPVETVEGQEVLTAFPGEPIPEESEDEKRRRKEKMETAPLPEAEAAEEDLEFEDEFERDKDKRKSKRKKRQLIYDEESGRVVARRKRKGSRRRDEWEDYID
jgi:transcription termination/antitermination protein NusA